MVGLAMLAAVAVYIGFWWWVVGRIPNRWGKGVAILAAIAIPLWDLPIGYLEYRDKCEREGGLKVLQEFPPQKSLYFSSPTGIRPDYLMKVGLETVEYRKSDGQGVRRFTKTTNGALQETEELAAISPLRIRLIYGERFSWDVDKQGMILEDGRTGQTLAQASMYTWSGGWLYRTVPFGPPHTCHAESLDTIVRSVVSGSKAISR